MSFPGYGLTLFDPKKSGKNLDEIPNEFTIEYFSSQFLNKWTKGMLSKTSDGKSLIWSIPELSTGDDSYPFEGQLSIEDKGISFGLTPYSTIVEFIRWIRTIIPAQSPMYFFEISEFLVLTIQHDTTDEEILNFLKQ